MDIVLAAETAVVIVLLLMTLHSGMQPNMFLKVPLILDDFGGGGGGGGGGKGL